MDLGNTIKNLRQSKQLSQEKLGELIGVSRQAVSKWETGLSSPDTENLIKLSKILNVSLEALISTKEKLEETNSIQEVVNGKQTLKIGIIVTLTIIIIILAITIIISQKYGRSEKLITQKNEELISRNIMPTSNEEQEVSTHKIDYLNMPDSVALQNVAQNFAKAYFSQDIEETKLYLADIEIAEVYKDNVYDKLAYMTLKWSPEDLATKATIGVQYQFQLKDTDSADYLGIDLMKINEKWKITSFYLEK